LRSLEFRTFGRTQVQPSPVPMSRRLRCSTRVFHILRRLSSPPRLNPPSPARRQRCRLPAMVRLTADLIWKSPHFFNAIKERELDLRGCPLVPRLSDLLGFWILLFGTNILATTFAAGNKIAVVENLGATEVSYTVCYFYLSLQGREQVSSLDISVCIR
jgi:hypothetical protein